MPESAQIAREYPCNVVMWSGQWEAPENTRLPEVACLGSCHCPEATTAHQTTYHEETIETRWDAESETGTNSRETETNPQNFRSCSPSLGPRVA